MPYRLSIKQSRPSSPFSLNGKDCCNNQRIHVAPFQYGFHLYRQMIPLSHQWRSLIHIYQPEIIEQACDKYCWTAE